MTPMTQIIYEGLNITYMNFQVEIDHPRDISCELGNPNGFLLKLREDGRLGKGGHMANIEHTTQIRIGLSLWMD